MSVNLLMTLEAVAEKPDATKRDALTITRRVLRHICQQKAQIQAERRAMYRQACKLRRYLPFTAKAADDLEQQASAHKAETLGALRRVLIAYGKVIIQDRDGLAAELGFDLLADLLSINPAHREQARQSGGESLQGLAYIARMEDSATHHGKQWGEGGPLYQACKATMMDFIRTCPDHLLPDPFAPGAPFGPPLPPELRVV